MQMHQVHGSRAYSTTREFDSSQWLPEADFFDRHAEPDTIRPLNPRTVSRYKCPKGPWAIDFQFRLAGNLNGKRILDVGAGTGDYSLVFAALGAKVTAIDISPCSLKVLQKRAELSGVSGQIETICTPLELLELDDSFDIVWVDAFLHHVLSNLDLVLGKLKRLTANNGRLIIAEPFAPTVLRRIRLALPIKTCGTPGERPLNRNEVHIMQSHFPDIQSRYFLFLSRVQRYFPPSRVAKLAAFDNFFLRLPIVKFLGGSVVLWTGEDR